MLRSFKDAFVQHGEQHIMVELRDQGYVEINGLHDAPEAAKQLEQFYQSQGCKAGLSLCPEGASFRVFEVSFGAECRGSFGSERGQFQIRTWSVSGPDPDTWSLCCFMMPSCPSFLGGSEDKAAI